MAMRKASFVSCRESKVCYGSCIVQHTYFCLSWQKTSVLKRVGFDSLMETKKDPAVLKRE